MRDAATPDVPAAARGPAIDPRRGYLVEELGGGACRVADGDYQTCPRRGGRLRRAGHRLIYSHSHYDHIGAAHPFKNATVISHAEIAKTLRQRNDPRRRVPDVTFQNRLTVEVGSQQLVLEYRGLTTSPAISSSSCRVCGF